MLSPTWPQLKIGSLLRNERDTRLYLRSFASRHDEITGTDRLLSPHRPDNHSRTRIEHEFPQPMGTKFPMTSRRVWRRSLRWRRAGKGMLARSGRRAACRARTLVCTLNRMVVENDLEGLVLRGRGGASAAMSGHYFPASCQIIFPASSSKTMAISFLTCLGERR